MLLPFRLSLLCLLLCVGLARAQELEPLERQVHLMGTSFHVTVFEADRSRALAQSEAIIRIVEDTENQLSNWRPDTEISAINRLPPARPIPLSSSVCELLGRVQSWVSLSQGAFDPAVGRLLQAHGIQEAGRLPSTAELATALSQSGFHRLRLVDCTLTKTADVLLDSGAFGKGEALDRVVSAARAHDYSPFLIDFGGQLLVWKTATQGGGWPARLADPTDRNKPTRGELVFTEGSLSTSGGSERDLLVEGRRIGHILDPRTGLPCPAFGSVTVWHSSAFAADALSTALYVMGPETGYRWAEEHNIAACFLIVVPEGEKMTPAFEKLITSEKIADETP